VEPARVVPVVVVPVIVVELSAADRRLPQRHSRDREDDQRRDDQVRAHADLDVARVVARQGELEQGTADQGEDQRVQFPLHSSTAPTATAARTATTNVAGANRTAKRRPNVPACIANSFASTIGPT